MTATNMCSNFGGKWDSPPFGMHEQKGAGGAWGIVSTRRY